VLFSTLSIAQQDSISNTLPILDVIEFDSAKYNLNKITLDTYAGVNVNTFSGGPDLQELIFASVSLNAFRHSKVGILFAVYSEAYKQNVDRQLIDVITIRNINNGALLNMKQIVVLQNFNIETTLTHILNKSNNFNLYGVVSVDMSSVNITFKDAVTKNDVLSVTDYILYTGAGVLFDINSQHISGIIMPTIGYYTSEYTFDSGFYYKLRFDIKNLVDNFSIGSSYVKLNNNSLMFINISYRISLIK